MFFFFWEFEKMEESFRSVDEFEKFLLNEALVQSCDLVQFKN